MSSGRANSSLHRIIFHHFVISLLLFSILSISFISAKAYSPPPIYITPLEDHFEIISGNLTVGIMNIWPRVVFYNYTSTLSPSFDLALLTLRIYNKSIDDVPGKPSFDHPELVAPSEHLTWDHAISEINFSAEKGQYAIFKLSSVINLFDPLILTAEAGEHLDPIVENWGYIELQFEISQFDPLERNLHPSETILQNHRIQIALTIHINDPSEFHAMAIEQNFQGGGRTFMARIYSSTAPGENFVEEVSTFTNELKDTSDISHEIPSGTNEWQMISLATATGAEQALFAWNRSYLENLSEKEEVDYSHCFYRTTGTSIGIFSLFYLDNQTVSIETEQVLSIIDSGFYQPITNIILDFMPFIVGLFVLIPSIVLAYRFARIRKASRVTFFKEDENGSKYDIKPK